MRAMMNILGTLTTAITCLIMMYPDVTQAAGLTAAERAFFTASASYSATVSIATVGNNYTITSSGMPDHAWESVNPNTPTAQSHSVTIPSTPTVSATKGCLPMGKVAISRTGVSIYNPLAGGYVNAVEGSSAETFDSCDGHASPNGEYHYHKLPSSCLWQNEVDYFIGVAMDGFPIYGPNTTGYSDWVTTSDLDDCHGLTVGGEYRYVATTDFPYLLGCYHGVVIDSGLIVYYDCAATSSYTAAWGGYLCSCHEIDGYPSDNMMGPPPPFGSHASRLHALTSYSVTWSFVLLLFVYLRP